MADCKACRSPRLAPLYRLERTPVFVNRLYESRAAARACPTSRVELVACRRCGFIFNAAFEDALMTYDAAYIQSQGHSAEFARYSEALADEIAASLPPGGKVVEIGCGREGYFLEMLAARGVDVRGFDPVYEGKSARVERAYFDRAAAARVHADVLVMRLVLYLLERPFDFLADLRAFLPADTVLVIETPRFEHTLAASAFWDVSHEVCDYFTEAFVQRMFADKATIRRAFSGQYMIVRGRLGDLVARFPDADVAPPPAPLFAEGLSACRAMLAASKHNLVWGAGSKGGAFALTLDPDAARIEALVDINPDKQGRFLPLSGHPCVAPADVAWDRLGGDACLWIMNANYKDEILASIPGFTRGRTVVLDEAGALAAGRPA